MGYLKPYRRTTSKFRGQDYNEWRRNQQAPFIPDMFGAKGDGYTNDTSALQAMFDAMKEIGHPGLLTGRYLINEGELVWEQDLGSGDQAGPMLYTAGDATLVAAGVNDAPLLTIRNNTPGRFVKGGYIGPLHYEDTTTSVAPNRHGLYLSGVQDIHFGPIYSNALKGHLVFIPNRTFDANGDFHHVFNCYFEQIEALNCPGYAFYNDSENQLLNSCYFQVIRAIRGRGSYYGSTGAGNVIYLLDNGGASEVACNMIHKNGGCTRLLIVFAEFDSPREALRINGITGFVIQYARINYRRLEGGVAPWIPAGETWPIAPITIGGVSGQIDTGEMNFAHRLSPEINNISKFPIITDYSNTGNLFDINVKHRIIDGVGIGIGNANIYKNISALSYGLVIQRDRRKIFNNNLTESLVAYYTGSIGAGSYAAAPSRIIFGTVISTGKTYTNYDPLTGIYTAPFAGLFHISASFRITTAAATLFRMAIMRTRAAVVSGIHENVTQVPNAASNTYALHTMAYLEEGDQVWVSCAVATGPIVVDAGFSAQANNHFEVRHVTTYNE